MHTRIEIDLAAAYPAAAKVTGCIRTFELDKVAGRLRITDSFALASAQAIETAIMTLTEPIIGGDNAATLPSPKHNVRIIPTPGTRIARAERHEYSDHGGKPAWVYRLVLEPAVLTPMVTLSYELALV